MVEFCLENIEDPPNNSVQTEFLFGKTVNDVAFEQAQLRTGCEKGNVQETAAMRDIASMFANAIPKLNRSPGKQKIIQIPVDRSAIFNQVFQFFIARNANRGI